MSWKKIEDHKVRHIWKCEDEDCNCNQEEIEVGPTFYTNAGTPICENGLDMTYQRTEINVDAPEDNPDA